MVSLPVRVSWEGKAAADDVEEDEPSLDASESDSILIFSRKDDFPKTRRITFRRSETFDINAAYDNESVASLLAPEVSRELSVTTISGIPPVVEGEEVPRIRVNVKVDLHGMFTVSSSQLMQEIKEEVVEAPKEVVPETAAAVDTEEKMDVSEEKEGEEKKAEEKEEPVAPVSEAPKKKRFRKIDLQVTSVSPFGLSAAAITEANETELRMGQNDRILEETANQRNELESFIYELRNQLTGRLKAFLSDNESADLDAQLLTSEDWLYSDEGFESTKSIYAAKLKVLTDATAPAEFRLKESSSRAATISEMKDLVEEYKKMANATEDVATEHWTDEDREVLRSAASTVETWMYDELPKQTALSDTDTPIITLATIKSKTTGLRDACRTVLNKPKPVPKVEEPEAKVEAEMDLD